MQKERISQSGAYAFIEVAKGNSDVCCNSCVKTEKSFQHILKATVAHHQKTVAVFYVKVKPEVYLADMRVKLAAKLECNEFELGRSYLNKNKTMYVQELKGIDINISTLVPANPNLSKPTVMFFYKDDKGNTIGKESFKELVQHLLDHTVFSGKYNLEDLMPELKKIITTESFIKAIAQNIHENEEVPTTNIL